MHVAGIAHHSVGVFGIVCVSKGQWASNWCFYRGVDGEGSILSIARTGPTV